MHFPKYWARGEADGFASWSWSDFSLNEAIQKANSKAANLAARFRQGTKPSAGEYGYFRGPLREEVIKEIGVANSEAQALVTRNGYGALVLNTSNLIIVDIDRAPIKNKYSLWTIFKAILPSFSSELKETIKVNEELLKFEKWLSLNSNWGWRAYETANGFRLICTSHLQPAGSSLNILEQVGSDPLYLRLCREQNSFRARLTPKPWRIGMSCPPARWPVADGKQRDRLANWLKEYEERSASYATCRFFKSYGPQNVESGTQQLVDFHDQESRAASLDLQLG